MLRNLVIGIVGFMFLPSAWGLSQFAEIQTNVGTISILLDHEKAPITVENFVNYVGENFYQKTLFHRAIDGFVIQGGGYDLKTGQLKSTKDPIVNEANNGLSNLSATISMARTNDPNSATSQFFINLVDNTFLDFNSNTQAPGYAVFGEVIEGMEVANKIANLTKFNDLPYTLDNNLIYIEQVYLSEYQDQLNAITRVIVTDGGKVTSSPPGIKCVSAASTCSLTKPKAVGKAIKLKATPSKGFTFVEWTGDCVGNKTSIKLPLTRNHNCSANFKSIESQQ